MNKSQELDIMVIRANINAEEVMKQHQTAWYGQDPVVLDSPAEEEE